MRRITRGVASFLADDSGRGWPEFWNEFEAGRWEPGTTAMIDSMPAESVLVDVGAWIGPLTLYAAARGSRVVALEPDPVAFAALERGVAANEMRHVFALPDALAVEPWPVSLVANETPGGELGDSMTRVAPAGEDVGDMLYPELRGAGLAMGWPLPHVLGLAHVAPREIGLLKIDVEGYEETLMPALAPWLAEHRPPVMVAFHGVRFASTWFAGYSLLGGLEYDPRGGAWGDLVALP